MRAIGVTEFGGPEALTVVELPIPDPGPGQVRVRVSAAAVSPADTLLRAGALAARLAEFPPPYIPGMDASGVIDAIGPHSDGRLALGEPVVAILMQASALGGAYADYVIAPATSVVRAPVGATPPEASTLLMNALTAQLTLDALTLRPGDWLAVTGAAGAYGAYVVQLAAAAGIRVIADASAMDEDLVRALGATHVVPRGDGFAASVRAIVPDGVQALADGALLTHAVQGAIADSGAIAVLRGWAGPADRDISIHPIAVASAGADTAALTRLVAQAEAGIVTLRVADVLPAEQAAEAHRRMQAGGVRGRIVLDFS
jgi:NADPH2:quinone reductase